MYAKNNETILYILEDLVVYSFKLVNTARSTMGGKESLDEKEKEKDKEKDKEKEKEKERQRIAPTTRSYVAKGDG